jgi:hypothetical protein
MRLWIASTVVLCTSIAVWALPPREEQSSYVRAPEVARFARAATEIRRAHGVLMATRWADSLSALVLETAVDGAALAYPPSDLVTPEGDREARTLLAERLASFQVRDPAMTIGVVLQYDLHGAMDGVLAPFGPRPQIYVGERDGRPFCFVVRPERYPVRNAQLRSAWMLDECVWYAKYGVPGPAIAAWLEGGALNFAREGRAQDVNAMLGPAWRPDLPFGLVRPYDEPITAAACMTGDSAACERVVTDPVRRLGSDSILIAQSPISHVSTGGSSPFEVRASFLFSELEARYGAEAFTRFWKSEDAVPIAFQAAFDAELGVWMRDWVEEVVGPYRATPAPRAATLGWSALALLLFSGLASWKQVRRQVG